MEVNVKLIECQTTWQGEGRDQGERMLLMRFKYCNKKCPWCDTLVKMRNILEGHYKLEDIQKIITDQSLCIMITGGEPTIGKHLDDTLTLLNCLDYPLANVETNGFNLRDLILKADPKKNIRYAWSPKIFNETDWEESVAQLDEFASNKNVYLKIVYEEKEILNDFLKKVADKNINRRVFLMPEGTSRSQLISNSPIVFDACEKYKFNFSSRNHLIFNFI